MRVLESNEQIDTGSATLEMNKADQSSFFSLTLSTEMCIYVHGTLMAGLIVFGISR